MRENKIQAEVLQAIGSRKDCRLFRNHVGKIKDQFGKWHSFGLLPGSGDLIGWKSMVIGPEDVGKKVAVFLSIEVKSASGSLRSEQRIWQEVVERFGGIAIVVRSVEEAETKI
jgi:hypothetical protein